MKSLVSRVLARRVVAGTDMRLENAVGEYKAACRATELAKNRVYYGRLFCGAPAAALDETEA